MEKSCRMVCKLRWFYRAPGGNSISHFVLYKMSTVSLSLPLLRKLYFKKHYFFVVNFIKITNHRCQKCFDFLDIFCYREMHLDSKLAKKKGYISDLHLLLRNMFRKEGKYFHQVAASNAGGLIRITFLGCADDLRRNFTNSLNTLRSTLVLSEEHLELVRKINDKIHPCLATTFSLLYSPFTLLSPFYSSATPPSFPSSLFPSHCFFSSSFLLRYFIIPFIYLAIQK